MNVLYINFTKNGFKPWASGDGNQLRHNIFVCPSLDLKWPNNNPENEFRQEAKYFATIFKVVCQQKASFQHFQPFQELSQSKQTFQKPFGVFKISLYKQKWPWRGSADCATINIATTNHYVQHLRLIHTRRSGLLFPQWAASPQR